jgi:hypothetical protein
MFHLFFPTRECANLIWEAHYNRMAGHFGVDKIVVVLKKHFYWPKIRQDVSKYIRYFTSYNITNTTINNKGLYTPLPTPKRPWESISMDYMPGLPSTKKGHDFLFVVVDQFSKMAILIACKNSIILADTAKIFFK